MAGTGRPTHIMIALMLLAIAPCAIARAEEPQALQEPGGVETACDWLAAAPRDLQRPPGIVGVESALIDIAPAQKACDEALAQYPAVARFHYQAGRVAYVQADYARAFKLFSESAGMGHGLSMTAICGQYFTGRGLTESREHAREWCEKAAIAGDPTGMASLAYLHLLAGADDANMAKAKEWLDKAVAAGSPVGMYNFTFYYLRRNGGDDDKEQARNWLLKAAGTGYADAMVLLGRFHADGVNGFAADYDEAQRWFQKGAAAGNLGGLVGLGGLYETGKGVPQDYGKARELYQQVVESHDPNFRRQAMVLLGLMYANGHGVAQDVDLAQGWYDKALGGASEMERIALVRLRDAGPPK